MAHVEGTAEAGELSEVDTALTAAHGKTQLVRHPNASSKGNSDHEFGLGTFPAVRYASLYNVSMQF